jgi:hypothetical protein
MDKLIAIFMESNGIAQAFLDTSRRYGRSRSGEIGDVEGDDGEKRYRTSLIRRSHLMRYQHAAMALPAIRTVAHSLGLIFYHLESLLPISPIELLPCSRSRTSSSLLDNCSGSKTSSFGF